MSSDVVPSTCSDNFSCSERPGRCSIMNVSPLGYKADFKCAYSDGVLTYLCNPGCCPGGVAQGYCPNETQPEPTCTDKTSCDDAYLNKACKPHVLSDGRTVCGYIESTNSPQDGIVDMFYFCNPGCGACKGGRALGPCPGQSTTSQKVFYANTPPRTNPWLPRLATDVQMPIINRWFYALAILLIALAVAGTLALI
jgi:hypothetical protein